VLFCDRIPYKKFILPVNYNGRMLIMTDLPQCRPGRTRWFMLIIPLMMIPPLFLEDLRTVLYVTPCTILGSYIVLYHCPYFLKSMHTRPLYFEELEDNGEIDKALKKRFQDIFLKVINVVLAIVMGAIVDYAFYRFHDSKLSWFEILGLMGGMLSLYRSAWDHIGRILLLWLALRKDDYKTSRRKRRYSDSGDPSTPMVYKPDIEMNELRSVCVQ